MKQEFISHLHFISPMPPFLSFIMGDRISNQGTITSVFLLLLPWRSLLQRPFFARILLWRLLLTWLVFPIFSHNNRVCPGRPSQELFIWHSWNRIFFTNFNPFRRACILRIKNPTGTRYHFKIPIPIPIPIQCRGPFTRFYGRLVNNSIFICKIKTWRHPQRLLLKHTWAIITFYHPSLTLLISMPWKQ